MLTNLFAFALMHFSPWWAAGECATKSAYFVTNSA